MSALPRTFFLLALLAPLSLLAMGCGDNCHEEGECDDDSDASTATSSSATASSSSGAGGAGGQGGAGGN